MSLDPQPAVVQEETIASTKGVKIHLWLQRPVIPPRAVVVICHGVNAHGGQYRWTLEQFASAGLAAYALDLRGRGRSEGARFYVEDVADYVADVSAAIQFAKSREPGLPVFLLGHSAGGVVSCTYALDHQAELTGLICESFAYQVYAPEFALKVIKGLSGLIPNLKVLKLKNEDFSRDPKAVKALNSDVLTQDEAQPAVTVAALVRATERLKQEFPKITLPVFILHGSIDKVTNPSGSKFFHATAGSQDKTLRIYEGHAHDLLNDLEKEKVMADLLAWIDQRLPRV